MANSQQQVRRLVNKAKSQGWRVRKGRGDHLIVYPPDGSRPWAVGGSINKSSESKSIRDFARYGITLG